MLDNTLAAIISELFRITQANQRARFELDEKDARIQQLESELDDLIGTKSTDNSG